ncbi:hypothetical protein Tco_1103856 [Tanacetum coccineum]
MELLPPKWTCAVISNFGFCTFSVDVSGLGSFWGIETSGVGTRGIEELLEDEELERGASVLTLESLARLLSNELLNLLSIIAKSHLEAFSPRKLPPLLQNLRILIVEFTLRIVEKYRLVELRKAMVENNWFNELLKQGLPTVRIDLGGSLSKPISGLHRLEKKGKAKA